VAFSRPQLAQLHRPTKLSNRQTAPEQSRNEAPPKAAKRSHVGHGNFEPEDQTEAAPHPQQEAAASEGDQEEMEADALSPKIPEPAIGVG
jgi:hypothetical protein